MLTVPASLSPSGIHGLGLFADRFIARGTTVWVYNDVLDRRFTRKGLRTIAETQPSEVLVHLCTYSYKRRGLFWYMGDNARFINHSTERPNIGLLDDLQEVALLDIQPGEELVENYFDNYDEDDFFVVEQHELDLRGWLSRPASRTRHAVG